jgi:phosphopantothenoylcysteine synthetase/decarboxylase
MSKSKKILFQMTGSIAAYKACGLISQLIKNDYDVQSVGSRSLSQFVGPATLEGLTGKPVLTDVYEPGKAMDHINLARNSDLMILCPATANSINKVAAGIADDIIGALFLANNFKTPYWIVPAMNSEMYKHPATQDSLKKLEKWGVRVFETNEGRLACGEGGLGKMLEPDELFKEIEAFFKKGKKK